MHNKYQININMFYFYINLLDALGYVRFTIGLSDLKGLFQT